MRQYLMRFRFLLLALLLIATLTACSDSDDSVSDSSYGNHIVLTGEDNMRDLGGYESKSGGTVKYQKLLRSGELSALTDADKEIMTKLGIKQVIDLRTDSEATEKPDSLPAGITSYHISLIDGDLSSSASNQMMADIMSGALDAKEYMMQTYVVDDTKIDGWKKIFDLLETGSTTLWHCTAGKDRAGMTTALVLLSLGVDEDTVVADFMKSNDYLADYISSTVAYMDSQYGAGVGERLVPLLGVEQVYIETFLADIKSKYGSVDAFLDVLGVDKEKMRRNFIEYR